MENARWNNMQHMLYAVEFECMTSVRTTLKTRDHIIVRGQNINNFALSFISPLET